MGLAPSRVLELVEQFHRNRDEYRKQGLNETQLRREYLDPFFEALGWDVANREGNAPAYREVIHEDAVRIGGVEKAPDYSFRVGGTRKFFVEAKNPSINLKDDPRPAYQLRRYAWSARLPLSILSDFEEFVVYDCRTRPAPTDKPSAGRSLYLTYRDYEARWDEIADIFAKESVLKGSFDKYAASERKRGTATVDKEFLAEIEQWRELLAKHLAPRHLALDAHDLNFAVQRTIDRIIFLRICEDRGVEHYGQLQSLLNGEHTYERLKQLFSQADDRYNSGLFHFQREAGRAEAPDELTPRLKIEDKVLKNIIERLYAPKSPYEFSVFPAEILGQVYEQFLGKVIRLTAGHQAKVEEKPEVKKAGGVYYTPAYIVDYIVKHTVGALCEGKAPKQIAKLRILDPACGSGSFLIGAYQYLLTYHRDWYVNDGPDQHKKELFKTRSGDWRLKSEEKKRILLNNIHGVDIDSQAVEVTKLSLLLKVLEGENEESLQELLFGRVRVLPDLGKNIKCGNSLIGPDYFTGQLLPDEEAMRQVNPFDWQAEFSEIMQAGGFSTVIGNPPYGYMISEPQQEYFSSHYQCQDYQKDLYLLFLERYEHFLREGGLLGVIVSNTWLQSVTLRRIRKYLSSSYKWLRVLLLPKKVFHAVVDTHVLIFQRVSRTLIEDGSVALDTQFAGKVVPLHSLPWHAIPQTGEPINVAASGKDQNVYQKIRKAARTLSEICNVFNGIKPFEKGKGSPPQTEQVLKEQPYVSEKKGKGNSWAPLLRGSFIRRYANIWNHDYWIRYGPWLAAPRDPSIFDAPIKIMVRQTGDSIVATLIEKGFYARNNLHILLPKLKEYDLRYILGIMNSRMMDFIYSLMNPEKNEALAEVKKHHVEQLPIRPVNFSSLSEKGQHDLLVKLVERMLDLHERLAAHLFPDWAGRFRDVNVQIGGHQPPPFYEVPVLMRQFCDDLAERLRHVDGAAAGLIECLAWADWRFQWIHPFKDFNGRIGRVLLAALLYQLNLPHVETAPLSPEARTRYVDALRAADAGDLAPLQQVWMQRLWASL